MAEVITADLAEVDSVAVAVASAAEVDSVAVAAASAVAEAQEDFKVMKCI